VVDGIQIEGTFRAHQVPLAGVRDNPEHLKLLESWMRSYRPEKVFDADGRLIEELAALAPRCERRMGASDHANGGKRMVDLDIPNFRDYALEVKKRATAARQTSASSARTRPPRTGWARSSRWRTAVWSIIRFPRTTTSPSTGA